VKPKEVVNTQFRPGKKIKNNNAKDKKGEIKCKREN